MENIEIVANLYHATTISPGYPSPRLCNVCADLDILNHVWNTSRAWKGHVVLDLGSAREIQERAPSCELCQLLTTELEKHGGEGSIRTFNTEDSVKMHFHEYATMKYKNSPDERLSISYVTVQVNSYKYEDNPGPPVSIEHHAAGQELPHRNMVFNPWDLLVLQPCIDPVPTVLEFCNDVSGKHTTCEANKFSGRFRDAMVDLRLARRWLDICQTTHGSTCRVKRNLESFSGLRMIDVVDLAVVEAPNACEYLALSYCWGEGPHYKCTQENRDKLAVPGGLDLTQLPNTLRDAIAVARAIQVRYLWVDALCIIQDNVHMLAAQIPHMDSIYADALFTIVAAAGDNANSGLPGVQHGSREARTERIRFNGLNLIVAPSSDVLGHHDIHSSAWHTRAWTFQEERFNPRKLVFTRNRLIWFCAKAYWTEHETREPSPPGAMITESWPPYTTISYLSQLTPSDKLRFQDYTSLLSAYYLRQMGCTSDSLNAFAGIERYFFSPSGHKVIWGHPVLWFAQFLLWHIKSEPRQHGALCEIVAFDDSIHSVAFPSWSWCAWERRGRKTELFWWDTKEVTLYSESAIIFYHCSKNGCVTWIDEIADRIHNKGQVLDATILSGQSPTLPPWIEHPRTIEPCSDGFSKHVWDVSSGLLKFWSSVGKVYLHRRAGDPRVMPVEHIILDKHGNTIAYHPNMQSTTHLKWLDNLNCGDYPPQVRPRDGARVLAFDAVVIRTNAFKADIRNLSVHLDALLVEWIGGIAYRRGLFFLPEAKWMALERKWTLITLG